MSLPSPRARLFLTRLAGWLACFLIFAGGRAAYGQDLRLQFHAGLVDLSAHAVSVAEILARWSEVGGTTVVNGDQVQSGPVTIDLVDTPEGVALGIILRSVPGYLLAEGANRTEARSVIDRIVMMATRTTPPTTMAVVPSSPPAAAISPSRVMPSMLPEPDEPNRDGFVIIGAANETAERATGGSLQGTTQVTPRPGFVQSSGLAGKSRAITPSPVTGRAGETTVPSTPPAYVPNSQPPYGPPPSPDVQP